MNWDKICKEVNTLVVDVGHFIGNELGNVPDEKVKSKEHNSLVSYVDEHAEKMLVSGLSKLIPSSGFITEEQTKDTIKEYTWIIDPLDGTTNFLYGIPHFSTSVALQYKGKLVLGVISDIMRKDIYYAWENGGAWLNNNSISVSGRNSFSEALIATGFPYEADYDKEPYFNLLEVIMRECRGLRRFGSAALDMAYVACGRFDAFYETSLNPWDVSGGMVICEEAGAKISDYNGGNSYFNGKSLITGSPIIHDRLVELTKRYFNY